MDLYKILLEKQKVIQHYGLPSSVVFTVDEINLLSDSNLLRVLKLTHKFPTDFKCANNLLECTKMIVAGDDIYRVLEFCILKNRVLRMPVSAVFPRLGDHYDS